MSQHTPAPALRYLLPIGALVLISLASVAVFGAQRGDSKPTGNSSFGDGGVSAFYSWNAEIPPVPGKLLRQEPLPENLVLANASRSIRVLYSSTDGIDEKSPIVVSGAVYIPKGSAPATGWPIIAWAHGTTGIADVCAPSWAPRSQRDTDYLNAWLAQGYAIVATDYQGLGTPGVHPWVMVKPEAYSVLDGVRAAIGGISNLANSVVIVGQSQGAHAALSSALLAGQYAPALKINATVATGVPNPEGLVPGTSAPHMPIPALTGSGLSAVIPLLNVYSLIAVDRGFQPDDYVSDIAKPVFKLAQSACMADLTAAANRNNLTVENVLKQPLDEGTFLRFQQYPTPKFAQPVFIGTGLSDVAAFPEGQYDFAAAACYLGSKVEMHYYAGKDHSGAVPASLVDSEPFVKKAFAGESISGNCASIKPPVPDR